MVYLLLIVTVVYLIISTENIEKRSKKEIQLNSEFSQNKPLIDAIEKYAILFVTNKLNYLEKDDYILYKNLERYVFVEIKKNIIKYPIVYAMNNKELRELISNILKNKHVKVDLRFWRDYYKNKK